MLSPFSVCFTTCCLLDVLSRDSESKLRPASCSLFCRRREREQEREAPGWTMAQVQCACVLKISASSFSIKLPGTVNQLGNLNRPSHADILWLTIISETGFLDYCLWRPGLVLVCCYHYWPFNKHSALWALPLLTIVNYAIPGENCQNTKIQLPVLAAVLQDDSASTTPPPHTKRTHMPTIPHSPGSPTHRPLPPCLWGHAVCSFQ